MTGPAALAVRRGAIAASALAATLTAHAAGTGGLHFVLAAPLWWASLVGLAVLLGRRAGGFRPRRPVATLGLLLLAQAALHLGVSTAPWAFGLEVHHATPLLTPAAVAAHVVAALALGALLARLDAILAGLSRAVRVLARLLRRSAPGRPPRVAAPLGALVTAGAGVPATPPARGPPIR
jgi:hypothetical protein